MQIVCFSVQPDSGYIGRECPVCLGTIALGDDVAICPVDGMLHHVKCWQANGNQCASPTVCHGRGVISGECNQSDSSWVGPAAVESLEVTYEDIPQTEPDWQETVFDPANLPRLSQEQLEQQRIQQIGMPVFARMSSIVGISFLLRLLIFHVEDPRFVYGGSLLADVRLPDISGFAWWLATGLVAVLFGGCVAYYSHRVLKEVEVRGKRCSRNRFLDHLLGVYDMPTLSSERRPKPWPVELVLPIGIGLLSGFNYMVLVEHIIRLSSEAEVSELFLLAALYELLQLGRVWWIAWGLLGLVHGLVKVFMITRKRYSRLGGMVLTVVSLTGSAVSTAAVAHLVFSAYSGTDGLLPNLLKRLSWTPPVLIIVAVILMGMMAIRSIAQKKHLPNFGVGGVGVLAGGCIYAAFPIVIGGLLALILGPLGWLIGAVIDLFARGDFKSSISQLGITISMNLGCILPLVIVLLLGILAPGFLRSVARATQERQNFYAELWEE